MEILKYLKSVGVKVGTREYLQLANQYKIRAMTDFISQEVKDERKKRLKKFFRLKESLYEKFEEGGDPVADLGIGIRAKLEKESLKVKKHQSAQGYKIAAYMSHFSMISEENLYLLHHLNAKTILNATVYDSTIVKQINDMETGIGIGFILYRIEFNDDVVGFILKEQNSFSTTYWGDLNTAIKVYELENLTDN